MYGEHFLFESLIVRIRVIWRVTPRDGGENDFLRIVRLFFTFNYYSLSHFSLTHSFVYRQHRLHLYHSLTHSLTHLTRIIRSPTQVRLRQLVLPWTSVPFVSYLNLLVSWMVVHRLGIHGTRMLTIQVGLTALRQKIMWIWYFTIVERVIHIETVNSILRHHTKSNCPRMLRNHRFNLWRS